MEKELQQLLLERCGKGIEDASNEEIYGALLILTKRKMEGMKRNEGNRKLYYISAEFLIGKLLSNNLINLGMFEETREVLAKYGKDLTAIEEIELEPSLGNGGLGRLAACFLDSIATLGLCGDSALRTTSSGKKRIPGSRPKAGSPGRRDILRFPLKISPSHPPCMTSMFRAMKTG